MKIIFALLLLVSFTASHGQNISSDTTFTVEQFKSELLSLRADVNNIQMNVGKSERRFKSGIAVATIGYSVTIAGGLMLGRKQDDLGKALLVVGGLTGVTGTILMVDAFKFLGRAARKRSPGN